MLSLGVPANFKQTIVSLSAVQVFRASDQEHSVIGKTHNLVQEYLMVRSVGQVQNLLRNELQSSHVQRVRSDSPHFLLLELVKLGELILWNRQPLGIRLVCDDFCFSNRWVLLVFLNWLLNVHNLSAHFQLLIHHLSLLHKCVSWLRLFQNFHR